MMNATRFAVMVMAAATVGCADSIVAPIPQTSIVGTWFRARPPAEPPGSFVHLFLSLNNGSITGNGAWSGEAGPFGPVAITGAMIAESVQLDLTFSTDPRFGGGVARHATFSGRLKSDSELVGSLAYDGQPASDESFAKVVLLMGPNR